MKRIVVKVGSNINEVHITRQCHNNKCYYYGKNKIKKEAYSASKRYS